MKILLYPFILIVSVAWANCDETETKLHEQLVGVWKFKNSVNHYSLLIEKDHFFGEDDELRFYDDEGLARSFGVTLRSTDRTCSIGDLYLIWVEQDKRGIVFYFGSKHDPVIFVGSIDGKKMRFEFVNHGTTRIEYEFERISSDPQERPRNTR